MTCNAKGNLRYRARTTTATIALVAGGYLVMSGTTAEPAAGESSNRGRKGDWSTQVWQRRRSRSIPPTEPSRCAARCGAVPQRDADCRQRPQTQAARKRSNVDGKEEPFPTRSAVR